MIVRKKLIFARRANATDGAIMSFHNMTSLVIFDQIVRPYLTSSNEYWKNRSIYISVWCDPIYNLVKDKKLVYTELTGMYSESKRVYNLKKLLRSDEIVTKSLRLSRMVSAIGYSITDLMPSGFLPTYLLKLPDKMDKELIESANESMINEAPGSRRMLNKISDEILTKYYESSEYSGKMLRDDFGMMQNVMRNKLPSNTPLEP